MKQRCSLNREILKYWTQRPPAYTTSIGEPIDVHKELSKMQEEKSNREASSILANKEQQKAIR
jgi:hypothetical protein